MKLLAAFLTIVSFVSATAFSADFPKDSPAFVTSLTDALAKAKETSKPVIVIFSAAWCPPCQTMKKSVYPSAAVKPYHDKFVWAYLDADEKGNAAAMSKFSVSGIPHIEFLDTTGKSVDKQVGGSSANNFARKLEGILKTAGGASTTAAADKK